VPHRVGDPNRKARVERFFHYVENNFLAGRRFADWHDLNRQADDWCRKKADARYMKELGMSPQEAFLMEKPHLVPLPPYVPPVYRTEHRRVDVEGYVTLDTNRYSVPERFVGRPVEVHKYWDRVRIHHGRRIVAEHDRAICERNRRITAAGHHAVPTPRKNTVPSVEEKALAGRSEILDQYLALLKKRFPGKGGGRLRKLLHLQRTYPDDAFTAAINQALRYGLLDLARLERIILKNIADDFFDLD